MNEQIKVQFPGTNQLSVAKAIDQITGKDRGFHFQVLFAERWVNIGFLNNEASRKIADFIIEKGGKK